MDRDFETYQSGDALSVERIDNTVVYKQNGIVIYTSTVPSTGDLVADAAVYTQGGAINNAWVYGIDEVDLDSDGDGLPDAWETANGLNPENSDDASLDLDGDNISNLEEYVHNTNPTVMNAMASPITTPGEGIFEDAVLVTLSPGAGAIGATLYYTLDGSTPTTNSAIYNEPLLLTESTTINVIAVLAGYIDSAVVSASYYKISKYQLSTGVYHSCAIDVSGVNCWGDNEYDQSAVPNNLINPRQVSAGFMHTCALDDEGVKCWGDNEHDQTAVPNNLINPRQVSVGYWHTCALDDEGVKCWGDAGTAPDDLINPSQVVAGYNVTCAIDDEGVKCWGSDPMFPISPPNTLVNPRQLSVSLVDACALDDNGVTCWGLSTHQATTDGLVNPYQLAGGLISDCALDDNGMTCWSWSVQDLSSNIPTDLVNPLQIAVGAHHACVLDNNGVSCWHDASAIGEGHDKGQSNVPDLSFSTP